MSRATQLPFRHIVDCSLVTPSLTSEQPHVRQMSVFIDSLLVAPYAPLLPLALREAPCRESLSVPRTELAGVPLGVNQKARQLS